MLELSSSVACAREEEGRGINFYAHVLAFAAGMGSLMLENSVTVPRFAATRRVCFFGTSHPRKNARYYDRPNNDHTKFKYRYKIKRE